MSRNWNPQGISRRERFEKHWKGKLLWLCDQKPRVFLVFHLAFITALLKSLWKRGRGWADGAGQV
jgi:hypothetical protein